MLQSSGLTRVSCSGSKGGIIQCLSRGSGAKSAELGGCRAGLGLQQPVCPPQPHGGGGATTEMFMGARCDLAAPVHPAGSQAAKPGLKQGVPCRATGFGRAVGSDLPCDWQRYVSRAVPAGHPLCWGSSGGSRPALYAGAASAPAGATGQREPTAQSSWFVAVTCLAVLPSSWGPSLPP